MDPLPLEAAGRWVGVGRSVSRDSRVAGREAARQALTEAPPTAGPLRLLLAFVARRRAAAPDVLAGIRDVAPGVPLAGCSSVAGFSPSGHEEDGVVLVALGGDGLQVSTGVARDIADWQRTAGSTLASGVGLPKDLPHQALLLFTDGMVSGQQEVLRGVYGVLGASVPVFGAASSSPPGDEADEACYELHGRGTGADEVLTGSAVGVTLSSAAPITIGLRQGWRAQGPPMTVTEVRDDRVVELDNGPAMDRYLDRLGAPAEAYHDESAFSRLATRHPVGVRRRFGMALHDLSLDPDFTGRTLGGRSGLPEGSVIRVMTAQPDDLESVVADAAQAATDALAPRQPAGLLVVQCAAQRELLGPDGVQRGIAELVRRTDGVAFGGCFGFGEIARPRGLVGFHSRTAVALALG